MPEDYAKYLGHSEGGPPWPHQQHWRLPVTICLCLWHDAGLSRQPGL
jgi:hypothetical protein